MRPAIAEFGGEHAKRALRLRVILERMLCHRESRLMKCDSSGFRKDRQGVVRVAIEQLEQSKIPARVDRARIDLERALQRLAGLAELSEAGVVDAEVAPRGVRQWVDVDGFFRRRNGVTQP